MCKMTLLVNCVYFAGILFGICDSYKILLVFPNTGKSHKILGNAYADNLLEAGHEVTLITPFSREYSSENLTLIDVSNNMNFNYGQLLKLDDVLKGIAPSNSKYTLFRLKYDLARSTVESEGVQRLLKDPEQRFDLVIAEWLFSDFYAGFSAVFNCPYIWSVSFNPNWLVMRLLEALRNPEYCPDTHTLNSPPFSTTTRLREFVHQMNNMAQKHFIFDELERKLYEEKIVPILRRKGRNIPDFKDLVFNPSLLLVNSHPNLAQIMPMPPNCVTIGGYHITPKIQPLPEILQKLMDEARNGVIYFSMGTILRSETFPKHVIQNLLNMFKGLKQLILWNFNGTFTDVPSNVHLLSWVPQHSVFSHPNCVLFMTHGGYLSITEAVHFGVPVVVIPVFADQFANAAKVELKGFGRKVDLTYNLAEDLKVAIAEVIGNPRYKENVDQLSSIYHDQKSPRKRLVDWVEYVIRTRGAPQLRSPSLLMPWYQEVYLDLLLLILVVITVFCLFVKMLLHRLFLE